MTVIINQLDPLKKWGQNVNIADDQYRVLNQDLSDLEGQTNTNETNFTNHASGGANRHNTSAIDNVSGVVGANQTIVNDGLQGQINALVVGAANETIGVFSAQDGVNTDNYVITSGASSLFSGLKINLTVINPNTGTSTLNDTATGVKSIKVRNQDGTLRDTQANEIHDLIQLEYDGIQYVVNDNDSKETTRKVDNPFFTDIPAYYGNTKLGDDFQDETVWTSVAGTQSIDTTNIKIGKQSLKILENDNVANNLNSVLNNITLDFNILNNSEVSDDTDFIKFIFFISDINAIDVATGIRLDLSQASTFNTNDIKFFTITSGLVTGFNFIDIKKSTFDTLGSGSFSGIQSMRIRWASNINSINEFVSFQLIQLIKKDPISDIPNPFQRIGNRDFEIVDGEWFVGEEFNEAVIKLLEISSSIATALKSSILYNDFIAYSSIKSTSTINNRALTWEIDVNNRISAFIQGDILFLQVRESAVNTDVTKTLNINENDIITYKLEKNGTLVSLSVYVNNVLIDQLKNITALTNAGSLGLGGIITTSGFTYIQSASITEILHVHHSDISEIANSLTIQPRTNASNTGAQSIATGTTDIAISLDTDTYNFMFDDNSPTIREPKETGRYLIVLNADYVANATGTRDIKIKVNGVQVAHDSKDATTTDITGLSCTALVDINALEDITFTTWQDSTIALDITATLAVSKIG